MIRNLDRPLYACEQRRGATKRRCHAPRRARHHGIESQDGLLEFGATSRERRIQRLNVKLPRLNVKFAYRKQGVELSA
jgi:hypothetical protein